MKLSATAGMSRRERRRGPWDASMAARLSCSPASLGAVRNTVNLKVEPLVYEQSSSHRITSNVNAQNLDLVSLNIQSNRPYQSVILTTGYRQLLLWVSAGECW